MTTKPPLTPTEARVLASDLLHELAAHIGDGDAVAATMLRWLDVIDGPALARVSMAALDLVFTDCLTHTPVAQIPAGSPVYLNPKEA